MLLRVCAAVFVAAAVAGCGDSTPKNVPSNVTDKDVADEERAMQKEEKKKK